MVRVLRGWVTPLFLSGFGSSVITNGEGCILSVTYITVLLGSLAVGLGKGTSQYGMAVVVTAGIVRVVVWTVRVTVLEEVFRPLVSV